VASLSPAEWLLVGSLLALLLLCGVPVASRLRSGAGADADGGRFVPSPLDRSVRYAHGGGSPKVADERPPDADREPEAEERR
jgi:hypothetical protein